MSESLLKKHNYKEENYYLNFPLFYFCKIFVNCVKSFPHLFTKLPSLGILYLSSGRKW